MGIPKFFRWLTNKYDNLIINNLEEQIDNLYLDANCLIHPCVRKILDEESLLIKEHFKNYNLNQNNICNKIDIYSKLEKNVYICN